jgi:UDP-N-acetylmuramate--alanine ligase
VTDTKAHTSAPYAHFIGVGGAGMSALALVLLQRGIAVSGSDMKESRYTRELEDNGMTVCIGHDAANVGDPDVVVISTAIPETNPELIAARERGLEVWPRAKMLAYLTEDDTTIAVAGTHGKTSTSSMLASVLSDIGAEPSFCIGGQVGAFGANAVHGSGDYFVVEADESDGSFVHLSPHIAVITNLEADHIDHYGSLDAIKDAFAAFMQRVDADGTLVVCGDDEALLALARQSGRRVLTYGASDTCDIRYSNIKRKGVGSTFEVTLAPRTAASSRPNKDNQPLTETIHTGITLPGEHMVSNATSVLAVAALLGLDLNAVADALTHFKGVRRRFELIAEVGGVTIVDDYGHHPTEIAATLAGIRALDFKRSVVVFQPHRYSRTEAFLAQFATAFADADRVILMDVYSAGEAPIPGVSGRSIVEAVLNHDPRAQVAYFPHRVDIARYLGKALLPGDVLITMGAGDVTGIGPEYLHFLEESVRRG